jgi:excisionase family DNA binding protein
VAKENLLTTYEVTERLKVSASTVRRMAREGRLPAMRVGKLWRFPQQELTVKLRQRQLANARNKRKRRSGFFDWRSVATDIGFVEPFNRSNIRGRW